MAACSIDEVRIAAKQITDANSWFLTWRKLAEQAEKENRLMHSAYYYRLAEIFLKDSPEKEKMYNCSIENFQKIIYSDENIKVSYMPYQQSIMKSFLFRASKPKGTIVAFGGYDSFIEEFYLIAHDILQLNYDIILFEGPGQGQSLKNGLYFAPHWENLFSCVLDYYALESAYVIGISWGGYLALRAASYEKRITKVVSYDVLYDGFNCMLAPIPFVLRKAIEFLFLIQAEKSLNTIFAKMKNKSFLFNWAISHGQYITGTSTPYEFYNHLKKHTMKNIMHRVDCDVLLLAGVNDHYIPKNHYYKLYSGLVNARTLSGRIFTQKEGGAEHCQIGNHMLAINQIFEWLG